MMPEDQKQRKRREKVGVAVHCETCEREKQPIGRDAPAALAGDLCTYECPGYDKEPYVGDLWPGETREEFGY